MEFCTREKYNPINYVGRLGPSDHAVALCADAAFRKGLLFPFFRSGLLRRMATVYVVSERRMDRERREMRKLRVDIEKLEEEGAFMIISAEEWYMR